MKLVKFLTLYSLLNILCSPVFANLDVNAPNINLKFQADPEDYINYKLWTYEFYSNRISNDGANLWITPSVGILKYNKITGECYNVASEIYANNEATYTAIEAISDELVCYAEMYGFAQVWDGAKIDTYGYTNGFVYSFAIRPNGDVWASLGAKYIPPADSVIGDRHFWGYQTYNAMSSQIQSPITDMAFDSNGRLWIAMFGQYYYLGYHDYVNEGDMTKYVCSNLYSGPYKKITSIAIDSNDNIWYASDEGINCYYQATGQEVCMTKEQYPAMLENRYFGNDIDDNGNIWFTSENNLLKWDGSEFTTYTCDGYEEARSMLCDGNIVWVLLKNDTLLKFQNNEFEAIDLGPAITNTGINESIAETQNTKAFVTNEMLNIENAEGINSVVVYDATGKVISSTNANGATSTQIALPSTIKGVLIVKVNNEVVKVVK